jgi:hypothetical protein
LKRQRKQRGSGPETEIQKKIREELERILLIFTLFPDVRQRYTQKHMGDYTSEGATLIYALRDIYSSKRGEKAPVRNELVARIIKLIINEDIMEQSQGFGNPVNEGIGYNIRVPIIIPQGGVSLLALTAPSVILHYGAKCLGAFCHALSRITDDEAFINLRTITTNININTIIAENAGNAAIFGTFNNIKTWFDNKERRDDDGNVVKVIVNADYVATMLITNMPIIRNISDSNMEKYKNGLIKSIQKLNLLFFISNFFYDTFYYIYPQIFEYNDDYINKLFEALYKCIPVTESSAEYVVSTDINLEDNTGVSSTNLPVAIPFGRKGGKNTRRCKSRKKQNQKRI